MYSYIHIRQIFFQTGILLEIKGTRYNNKRVNSSGKSNNCKCIYIAYTPNNRASKHMKQKPTQLKERNKQIHNHRRIFSTNRTPSQEIKKYIEDLNSTIN